MIATIFTRDAFPLSLALFCACLAFFYFFSSFRVGRIKEREIASGAVLVVFFVTLFVFGVVWRGVRPLRMNMNDPR